MTRDELLERLAEATSCMTDEELLCLVRDLEELRAVTETNA